MEQQLSDSTPRWPTLQRARRALVVGITTVTLASLVLLCGVAVTAVASFLSRPAPGSVAQPALNMMVMQAVPARAGASPPRMLRAEMASTLEQITTGLMHRTTMGADDGMLFVMPAPQVQCFWMKNTLLPLSVAFLDDEGAIVNIEDMAPLTEVGHCSKAPVRLVLEMNQSWFERHGFGPGDKIQQPAPGAAASSAQGPPSGASQPKR